MTTGVIVETMVVSDNHTSYKHVSSTVTRLAFRASVLLDPHDLVVARPPVPIDLAQKEPSVRTSGNEWETSAYATQEIVLHRDMLREAVQQTWVHWRKTNQTSLDPVKGYSTAWPARLHW